MSKSFWQQYSLKLFANRYVKNSPKLFVEELFNVSHLLYAPPNKRKAMKLKSSYLSFKITPLANSRPISRTSE